MPCWQHDLLSHKLNEIRVRLAPSFPDCAACLQTKKGKSASGVTCVEWLKHLGAITTAARKRWQEVHPDRPFSECKFIYDNPNFHNITAEDRDWLQQSGYLDDIDQLISPPVYSGDFMQCIEHVHAIICEAWFKERFRKGTPAGVEERAKELEEIFYTTISAAGVTANVDKLWKLVNFVYDQGTGDYAPPDII